MRTTPTFILEQHKHQGGTQFACHIRNHTAAALSLAVPFGTLEAHPPMNDAAYQQLQARNRSQISMPPTAAAKQLDSAPAKPTHTTAQHRPATAEQNDENWES